MLNKSLVRRKSVIYSIIVAITILVVLKNPFVTFHSGPIDVALSYCIYPVLKLQHALVTPFKEWLARQQSAGDMLATIKKQQEELEQLQSKMIRLEAAKTFFEDTQEIIAFKQRYVLEEATLAQILIKHISDKAHFFIVDAGAKKGIKKNMVAIYKDIIIGKVVEVYPAYSKVMLISDRLCKVSAYCASTRAFGIHVGTNEQFAQMHRVSHLSDVQVGDTILTTGDGLIFPRGFALGRVAQVTRTDLFNEVRTEFLIDMQTLSYCYLVHKNS